MLADARYTCGTTSIEKGDLLVMCSDGVTETFDAAEVEFGPERLERLLVSHAGASPAVVQHAVEEALEKHAGGVGASDDLTMIVIRRSA